MKKIIALLLTVSFTVMLFVVPSAAAAETTLYGDANGDGTLTVSDATSVQRHLAKINTLSDERLRAAKVSGNKEISIKDATLIQEKIAGLIDKFPAEEQYHNIKDTLVVVFSRTGNTKPLAQYAADYLDADFFEIEAAVPYTDADIAYYTNCRADREQSDPSARPEIAGKVNNMSQYSTVVIAYPIWHGQAPKIIYTFLESYDFSGKTIIPFCTSASSPLGTSASNLHALAPDSVWKDGKRFAAGTSREVIEGWFYNMGYTASDK